jgi:hypothetical protein
MRNPDDKAVNPLDMSDEEFLNMGPSAFDSSPGTQAASTDAGGNDDDDDQGDGDQGTDGDGAGDDAGAGGDDDKGGDDAAKAAADAATAAAKDKASAGDTADSNKDLSKDKDQKPAGEETQSGELTEAQFAAIGRQILSEFKANGVPIKMKSADDAIQLMQMGANYHKKMTGLKPALKTLKLLENHGLMDPNKLNYLIDLHQQKPEAIAQLLKDSKLNPRDIDLDETTNYVPKQRSVSDTELVLDEILDSISTSPEYNRTLNVLGNEWDAASRQALAQDPKIIKIINQHMESGVFDQVAEAVAYERRLGKLTGISDFEAYQRVGAHMHENNLFKRATGAQNSPAAKSDDASNTDKGTETDAERAARKKAASPSRHSPGSSTGKTDYNPLTMSDEEFLKLNKLNI